MNLILFSQIHLQYSLAADNILVSRGVKVQKFPGFNTKISIGSVGSTLLTTWLLLV